MKFAHKIIGICGRARHGKGTVADMIAQYARERGNMICNKRSFADPLKYFLSRMVGDRAPFYGTDAERNAPIDLARFGGKPFAAEKLWASSIGPTGRELMQYFGTEIIRGRFHSETWVCMARNDALDAVFPSIFDDVRFANEAAACDVVIGVARPGVPSLDHVSELLLDLEPPANLIVTIHNDSDYASLRAAVRHVCDTMLFTNGA